MSLWARAICYMCIVGGGWLVVLPALIIYAETGGLSLSMRSWPLATTGFLLLLLGAMLAMWAGAFLIQRGRGTPLPLDPPQRLVVSGPYRYVRNPQAISMVLMVAGEVAVLRSAWLWVMLPLTILYLEGIVGPIETRQLARDFGDDYRRYAASVRKWIPRIDVTNR